MGDKGSSRLQVWLVSILVAALALFGAVWWLTARYPVDNTNSEQNSSVPMAEANGTLQTKESVIAQGLQHVWGMAFLPDGRMVFSERRGVLSIISNGAVRVLATLDDVSAKGEGGLMGVVVDPAFSSNQFIYTCLSSAQGDIRVVRWKLDPGLSLSARNDIITNIPANTVAEPGRHSGCQIAFDGDGYLWVGTGDTARGDTAIQPKSLGGKVLRVTRDGKAAANNLGVDFDPRIYSYGHRNIQGLAFFKSPKHGVPGVSIEHGSTVDDEVNELKSGNFGWAPPANGYDESVPMTDKGRFPDAIGALWSSGNPTQAPSGGAILHGSQWKEWDGALAIAMLKGRHLKILQLDGNNKVLREEKILLGSHGRLRAVAQGPDGQLYVGSSNGSNDVIVALSPQ